MTSLSSYARGILSTRQFLRKWDESLALSRRARIEFWKGADTPVTGQRRLAIKWSGPASNTQSHPQVVSARVPYSRVLQPSRGRSSRLSPALPSPRRTVPCQAGPHPATNGQSRHSTRNLPNFGRQSPIPRAKPLAAKMSAITCGLRRLGRKDALKSTFQVSNRARVRMVRAVPTRTGTRRRKRSCFHNSSISGGPS